ncbi:MAG: Translation factor guf1 mitochondrial [Watsoniomyces obsoletus]|nr:MAG: Translation factor guf1 mitochondrial [Watsoniomyces obsoletus]
MASRITTLLLALAMTAYAASTVRTFNYTTVTGYFLQDEPDTDPRKFEYNTTNLGLINRPYDSDDKYDPDHKKTQWERFDDEVRRLNKESSKDVQYRLLYLGRHGEGWHNVAEAYYGSKAWDEKWSLLPGNGTVNWTDAQLTPLGNEQAKVAHEFWKAGISEQHIPAPESYYVSPLYRCLATADITFSNLELPADRPFQPIIKELLREKIGEHTCDERSSKTFIQDEFPKFTFESGFSEGDPLWKPDERETDEQQDARLKKLLDDVIGHDERTYISMTSHSGTTNSIMRVIGHRPFSLVPGALMPVLVKVEAVNEELPSTGARPSGGPRDYGHQDMNREQATMPIGS